MKAHEVMVGIGFLIMLIGCMAADSNLIFTAIMVFVGAVLILGGLKVEKRRSEDSYHRGNSYMVKHQLHRDSKRS